MIAKLALAAAFCATIPAANWMLGNVGFVCPPDGPCLIPVGFGIMAPSGVLMIGAALLLRDMLQRVAGAAWTLGAIFAGGALSLLLAPPALALASVAAFLLSELVDMAVYTPMQRRNLLAAVLASNVVGIVIDSAVFLFLAFGSLAFLEGQIIGKLWGTLAALPLIAVARRWA